MGEDKLVVGSYFDNTGTNDTGAAFLYHTYQPPISEYELLVGSRYTNSVLRYNLETGDFEGALVPPDSGGLGAPYGMTKGPDGDLYVGGCVSSNVVQYDMNTGAFLDVFVEPRSGGLQCSDSLCFGPDGDLYVCSFMTDQVLRYDGLTGEFIDLFAWKVDWMARWNRSGAGW